ncbi:dynein regulatory complex subunit 4-like [Aulostomus maculatus]
MPPKTKTKAKKTLGKSKKAGKETSSAVVDGLSTEEMSKDQLEEHIIRLREELDREREERSFFQLERDKIQAFWEICKRNLEETKAELRNRCREREEAEERHCLEISVYKQKLRHVLSEHHTAVSELKTNGFVATSLIQKQQTEAEMGLRRQTHQLQSDVREKGFHNQNCIKELKLKHQVELMELTNKYDRRIRELEVKFHKKMESMREAEKKKTQAEISMIEDRMKRRTETLIEEHSRAFRGAEEYYSTTQSKLLADQKVLKEELGEVKKQQARTDRELSAAQQLNQRLRESLRDTELKLPELRKQLEEHERNKAKRAASAARVKLLEQQLRDQTFEHEMLLQAFEKVERERDELLKKQTEAILDVQQRCGLKELLLERKLATLTETLEKKEAQLCATLSTCNVDQTAGGAAAMQLEEILESKNVTIRTLRDELARDCQDYDDLLQTCKDRLNVLGVPLRDFPFSPAEVILSGQRPAGPASTH